MYSYGTVAIHELLSKLHVYTCTCTCKLCIYTLLYLEIFDRAVHCISTKKQLGRSDGMTLLPP